MNSNLLTAIDALFEAIPSLHIELFKDGGGTLIANIPIGSKTGNGQLWEDKDGTVFLNTRYGQSDEINMDSVVEDISSIAWGWYRGYISRGYGPSSEWLPIWINEGRIKENIVSKSEYIIL